MNVNGRPYRTIWRDDPGFGVSVIDQTRLPHEFAVVTFDNWREMARAIRKMVVRGAPLIGVSAAYGLALAMQADSTDASLTEACVGLLATRPTAVNLRWSVDRMKALLSPLPPADRAERAWREAAAMANEDIALNQAIGRHGLEIIRTLAKGKASLNVLTHCNAGWLATVDWGTALAPVYMAYNEGIDVHVWVDETRPRNQGASLTAWELGRHGVRHTLVVDNTGGHLMQHGMVDLVIVGSDRTTAHGDVCNKIGTYLKALAAKDNGIPFYVGLPSPTIDWTLGDGVKEIPIEERDPREVTHVRVRDASGGLNELAVAPDGTPAANYGFDVTPARLVTGLITERGVCPATPEGLLTLFPERKP